MTFLRAFTFSLVALLSLSSFTQTIQFTNLNDDQVTIKGEGFSSSSQNSFQVNFYIDNNFINDINTNSNGSFSYTTPGGILKNNSEIVVKVLNFNGSGNHFVRSKRFTTTTQNIQFSAINNEQVTVVGSGFSKPGQSSYQVNVYVDNDFLDDINTNSNGSFSYTTPAGVLRYNSIMEVKVLNFNGSGNHYVRKYTFTQQPPTPTPTPRPTHSQYEISNYANQQARTVANRVANTLGKANNWKYNYLVGFHEAIRQYSSSSTNGPGYHEGLAAGESQGLIDGKKHASALGNTNASNEIERRFVAAVGSGSLPDDSVPVSNPSFGGLKPSNIYIKFVVDGEAQLQNRVNQTIGEVTWFDDGLEVRLGHSTDFFALSNSLNTPASSFDFNHSWFRADVAHNEWVKNGLGGHFDHHLYDQLSHSEKAFYESEFRHAYQRAIDEKYFQVKTAYHDLARNQGFNIGKEDAVYLNYEKCFEFAYKSVYTKSTIVTFDKTYPDAFETSFKKHYQTYATTPIIRLGKEVTLSEENGNGIYEFGEKLNITLNEVINVGGVSGNALPVSLSGNAVTAINTTEQLNIPALTKLGPQKFSNLAMIKNDVASDVAHSLKAKIGNTEFNLSFTISFTQVLSAFGSAQVGAPSYNNLQQYILKIVQDEFDQAITQQKNVYTTGTCVLNKIVKTVATLPNDLTANFEALKPKLISMAGEIPGNMVWGKPKKERAIKLAFVAEINKL